MTTDQTPRVTEEVAASVALALTRADRSKKWLSERSGIPYSTLCRKLGGHVDFSFAELYVVARALGVAPSAFTPNAFKRRDAA